MSSPGCRDHTGPYRVCLSRNGSPKCASYCKIPRFCLGQKTGAAIFLSCNENFLGILGSRRLGKISAVLQSVPKFCDQIKQLYYIPGKTVTSFSSPSPTEASLRKTLCKVTAACTLVKADSPIPQPESYDFPKVLVKPIYTH